MGPPGPWRGAAQARAQSQVGGPGLEWVLRGSPGIPSRGWGEGWASPGAPLPGPGYGVRSNLGERVCYRVSASVSVEPAACI